MTTRVLGAFDIETFDGTLLNHTDSIPLPATSIEAPTFARVGDTLRMARAERLSSARGAMIAFGLEAAVAFCFYCVWHFWHLTR